MSREWWTADLPVFTPTEIWTLLALLGELGHDPVKLLAPSQLELGALLDPDVRLSLDQQIAIHEAVAAIHKDSLFVALGKRLHLSTFGTAGFAVFSSPSLQRALQVLLRFAPLLNLRFAVRVECGEAVTISLERTVELDPQMERQFFACDVTKMLTFLKDLLGPGFAVRRLILGGLEGPVQNAICQHAGVAAATPAVGLRATIELDGALLQPPLRQFHPMAHRNAVRRCDKVLADLRERADITVVIVNRLRKLDGGVPTFAEISAELHMSERTLRRRLERNQTSYTKILEDMRREMAANYLLLADETTESIGERLGYSDAATFRHAFKRWTGEPPSAFRKAARAS
jgi:AraC-like DNA-binding protein